MRIVWYLYSERTYQRRIEDYIAHQVHLFHKQNLADARKEEQNTKANALDEKNQPNKP